MASIHPNFSTRPDPSLYKLNLRSPKIFLSQPKHFYFSSLSPQYLSDSSTLCCCNNSRSSGSISGDDDSQLHRWNSAIQDAFRNAKASFDEFVNSSLSQSRKKSDGLADKEDEGCKDDGGEWDWERWWKHFGDIDEQQRILSTLKSQLGHAVTREDYEDAARLKVAIAAASANDTVGRVMSYLDKAVKEERYRDAVLLRDYAGAGLVGWWAGVSENTVDPYGCIINISAEHGRYVARSFSPRQLASSMDGATLFEIFFIVNDKGDYRHQAVYLKRSTDSPNNAIPPPNVLGAANNFDSLGPTGNNSVVLKETDDDTGDSADSDEDSRFEDTLRDLIPGAKVKVLKVTTPGKVDRDFISKVVEQIIEEDDDDDDDDVEENDDDDDLKSTDDENNEKNGDILDVDSLISDNNNEDNSQIAVKVVVHGLLSNLPTRPRQKDLLRVPAKLERKGRMSFTITVEENGDDNNTHSNGGIGKALNVEKPKFQNQPSVDNVVLDLAKSIGKGRIPMKVLKDVSEMINLTVNQARRRQPLSGSTTFNRIDIPGTQDPLNGLYIGAHGLYTSEVVHLRHKYGQWKDDGHGKEPTKFEFYEYVEAVKLTGDPYLPAGQIAFRAKVGKGYQLPHRGIIPEEFGVIARYKGQGRLAEPGFKNPRWVDGELVILDGKHIKSGPVVGFLYWAPEYHFLVFFNRLRLHT